MHVCLHTHKSSPPECPVRRMAFAVDRLPAAPALSSRSYVYVEATNDSLGACRMVRKEQHPPARPPTCLPRQLCRAACVTLHAAHHQLQPCSLLAQQLHLTMGTPLAIAYRAVHWPLRTNVNLRRGPEPQPQPVPLPEPFSISQTEAGLQGKEVQLAARCSSLSNGAAMLLGPAASIVTLPTVRPHHLVHVFNTHRCAFHGRLTAPALGASLSPPANCSRARLDSLSVAPPGLVPTFSTCASHIQALPISLLSLLHMPPF